MDICFYTLNGDIHALEVTCIEGDHSIIFMNNVISKGVSMPVKQVDISSIEAKRYTKPQERLKNVRIDNNSSITMIKPLNDEDVSISFRYTATYGGVGNICVEGTIIYRGDVKELSSKWIEQGNLPDNTAGEVHTAIMGACMPEAVMLSRDLKLPPPIPLPSIKMNKKKKISNRGAGMEVA